MTPNEVLEDWLRTQTNAPQAWRVTCQRLINSYDMSKTWPRLLEAGATTKQIFSMINRSIRLAEQDVRRLPNTQERQSINEVKKAAKKLLETLQGAQLLNEAAPLGLLDGEPVFVAFTDYCANALEGSSAGGAPVVSLPEMLRLLQSQCNAIFDQTPVNSISRKKEDLEKEKARAFVRRLAHFFSGRFGKEMNADVTRIVGVVFGLENPLSDKDVEKILEDSPLKIE